MRTLPLVWMTVPFPTTPTPSLLTDMSDEMRAVLLLVTCARMVESGTAFELQFAASWKLPSATTNSLVKSARAPRHTTARGTVTLLISRRNTLNPFFMVVPHLL